MSCSIFFLKSYLPYIKKNHIWVNPFLSSSHLTPIRTPSQFNSSQNHIFILDLVLEKNIFSFLCSHLYFHYFVWTKKNNKNNGLDFIEVKLWSLNLSSLNSASKQGSCRQWSWPPPCSHTHCCTCYSFTEILNEQPRVDFWSLKS